MRIAIVAPNLVGDAVMATPALRSIRRTFADAEIVLVAKPAVHATLGGLPWFDERIAFDPRSGDRLIARGVSRRLRTSPIDWAVLFPNSLRSAAIAWSARARRRLGYARGGRGWLLTDRLHPARNRAGRFEPTPVVEYYARLARAMGCEIDSVRLELRTSADDESAADAAFEAIGIPAGAPVVCLNTGGAFGPAKRWPEASFAELARRMVDEREMWVVVLCGPDERDAARRIEDLSERPRVRSLAGVSPSIGLSKAMVRRSSLMVTTDSGPRHFAAAFGVPVVTIFGPTHIAWTRTYHPRAIHLQLPVDCGPCQKGVCPLKHHRCMTELDATTVYRAVVRLLDGESTLETGPRSVMTCRAGS